MKKTILQPIKVDKPPCHTQIQPRCLTCKKQFVCRIKPDYIKTAIAIQEILGDPQDDYELCRRGTVEFEKANEVFPATITIDEVEYKLHKGFYTTPDSFRLIYLYNDEYYVEIFLTYKNEGYVISPALHYHHCYELSNEDQANLIAAATNWRENNYIEPEPKEFINTTFFSAILNCEFYEFGKEFVHKCGDKNYRHVATLHQCKPKSKPVCKRKDVEG